MNIIYKYFLLFLQETCYLQQQDSMTNEQKSNIILLIQSFKDILDPEVYIPLCAVETFTEWEVYEQANIRGRTLH